MRINISNLEYDSYLKYFSKEMSCFFNSRCCTLIAKKNRSIQRRERVKLDAVCKKISDVALTKQSYIGYHGA